MVPSCKHQASRTDPLLSPAAVVWWLQAASIRPPERALRHRKRAPNCVPKPCSNLPTKTAKRPFWISKKNILFYLLQLLFGGSKLQASGLQNGPFATAKQHLIACPNRAQTYPQKFPNVPSEFLKKIYPFLLPAAVVWWLQAASIRPPEGTLRHSKTAPNCVPKPCSNLPTKTA